MQGFFCLGTCKTDFANYAGVNGVCCMCMSKVGLLTLLFTNRLHKTECDVLLSSINSLLPISYFYAQTSEKLRGAYWFGPVGRSVALSVAIYIRSRTVLNLIYRINLKNKRTRVVVVVFIGLVIVSLFRPFFDFCIVYLWNLMDKISGEPLQLGS